MKLIVFCVAFLVVSAVLWLLTLARRKRSIAADLGPDLHVHSPTFESTEGATESMPDE